MTAQKVFYAMIAAMILLTIGSGYIFIIFRDNLRNDITEITEKKLEVELADGELRQLRESRDTYEEYSYLRDDLQNILPEDKEQSEAIQRVVGLFAKAGVPISGINFQGTDGLPSDTSQTQDSGINGVASLPIDVIVPSPVDYSTAIKLLQILENSERHLNVTSFGLTAATSSDVVPEGYVNIATSIDLQLRDNTQTSPAGTEINPEGSN